MSFIHPALFYGGLAATSVPIIIHLLNRRRFKILDWAAMRFLLESVRQNRRRVQLEELILLALRCLAIFLLAMAVARFAGFSPSKLLPIGSAAQLTHVFVLDDSVSMGQKLADTTILVKAANDLAETATGLDHSDRLAIIQTSRPGRQELLFNLNFPTDKEGLAGRLRALQPADTTTQLGQALRTAGEVLDEVTTQKRLYVLSDFRRVDYTGAALDEIRAQLKALRDRNVEIVFMNYGGAAGPNLTCEDIQVLDRLAVAKVPVRVQLRVKNNGPARAENVLVKFVARTPGGEEVTLPAKPLKTIDPDGTELVQVSYAFPDATGAALEARLPGDTLAGDNSAHLACDIRPARKVLIVDGQPDLAHPIEGESFFLAAAIDPGGDHRYGNEVDVVPADRLAEVDFERYDAVMLANVGDFPRGARADGTSGYPQLEALAQYVRNGGGLAIFTGDRVNPVFYNDVFYAGEAGLCPLKVGPPAGDVKNREQFVRLQPDTIANDPVMRTFQGSRSQFTRLVRFYGWTSVEEPAPTVSTGLGPVRVLARFDNKEGTPQHSPAIVSRSFGSGTVLMVCSTADKQWTDWPKDVTYLAFVNDVLEQLWRPAAGEYTGPVGRRIDFSLPAELATARITLQTPKFPAEDVVTLQKQQQAGRQAVMYEQARHAGVYKLELDGADQKRTVLFARNVDPIEGRLEPVNADDLRKQLGVELTWVDKLAPLAKQEAAAGARQEYWKALLAAMLAVLALEIFLGQRFGHYQAARK